MSYKMTKLCPGWLELRVLKETLDGEPIGEVLRVGPQTQFAPGSFVVFDPEETTPVLDVVLVRAVDVCGVVEKIPEKGK